MELTDRQSDLTGALRDATKVPDCEAWGAFEDFLSAVATVAEGAEILVHPAEMKDRMNRVWLAYRKLWGPENKRILTKCLGGKAEFERVKNHPNGNKVCFRIIKRLVETHGVLAPGMEVDDMSVDDILVDELTE